MTADDHLTFLITTSVSGRLKDPAIFRRVMLRSDLFSTVNVNVFFSPFTTSTRLVCQNRRAKRFGGHVRLKTFVSGKAAVATTSGSLASAAIQSQNFLNTKPKK